MKILFTVENYSKSGGGMFEVVKQITERLEKKGHKIYVATGRCEGDNNENVKQFNLSGNIAFGLKGEVKRYEDYLLDSNFDIIVNFAAQQAFTDVMLPLLKRIKAKKVFVPTGFSHLYSSAFSNYFERMKKWMQEYDLNIFLSEKYRDIDFARKNGIKSIVVIPNAASDDEFSAPCLGMRKKMGISEKDFLILNVSHHTGLKGHKETMQIFEKAELINSVLLIIGDQSEDGCYASCQSRVNSFNGSQKARQSNRRMILASFPRSETVSCFQEANLFLYTSKIECSPLVLFECLAAKIPFLTTSVGNAEEIVDWVKSGLILPSQFENTSRLKNITKKILRKKIIDLKLVKADVKKSAKVLELAYKRRESLSQLATEGYEIFLKKLSWEIIVDEYEKAFIDLLKK